MEELNVVNVVEANKLNTKAFGPFMSERIILPDGRPGETLLQFLAEERLAGRYPILGDGALYRPVEERSIVVVPREWDATTPDELTGALVGVDVVGTIPVAEDLPEHGEILVVRLTEPDGANPADYVRSAPVIRTETDVCLGWDTWVDYPPGIPTALPEEEAPESEPSPDTTTDDDAESYW